MKIIPIGAAACLISLVLAGCYQQPSPAGFALDHKQNEFGNVRPALSRRGDEAKRPVGRAPLEIEYRRPLFGSAALKNEREVL